MKDLLKISFLGDIMCQKELNSSVLNKYGTYTYDDCFSNIIASHCLEDSDCVIGNLETPVYDNANLSAHQIMFNTPATFVDALKKMGLDIVSTANNHCLDQGIEGLNATINELDRKGIAHTGTYLTEELSQQILIKELCGLKLALIACTFGTNSEVNGNLLLPEELWRIDLLKRQNKKSRFVRNDKEQLITKYIPDNVPPIAIGNPIHQQYIDRLKEKIREAKKKADIVVVMPHIGGQYNPAPASYTRHTIGWLAETEADIIIAGHPHVPLGFEEINGKLCAYSLGNFCFTPGVGYYLPNVLADYGLILHTYWDKEKKNFCRAEIELIYNKVNEDGISQVWPASDYFNQLGNSIEKDTFVMEADAVMSRCVNKRWNPTVSTQPLSLINAKEE